MSAQDPVLLGKAGSCSDPGVCPHAAVRVTITRQVQAQCAEALSRPLRTSTAQPHVAIGSWDSHPWAVPSSGQWPCCPTSHRDPVRGALVCPFSGEDSEVARCRSHSMLLTRGHWGAKPALLGAAQRTEPTEWRGRDAVLHGLQLSLILDFPRQLLARAPDQRCHCVPTGAGRAGRLRTRVWQHHCLLMH